jgi:hypothetical protein
MKILSQVIVQLMVATAAVVSETAAMGATEVIIRNKVAARVLR